MEVNKVFSSFVCIKLTKGLNDISISYSQPGLGIGLVITILGLALFVSYLLFIDKININRYIDKVIYYFTITISSLVLFVLYIFPLIINILDQIK